MSLKQLFFEAGLGSSFSTPTFARGIRTENCVDMFTELNGTLAMVGTAKLSNADVTDSSAPFRKLLGHARPSTSAGDLVFIGKVHEYFS